MSQSYLNQTFATVTVGTPIRRVAAGTSLESIVEIDTSGKIEGSIFAYNATSEKWEVANFDSDQMSVIAGTVTINNLDGGSY